MKTLTGTLVTDSGLVPGILAFDGSIARLEPGAGSAWRARTGPYVMPGFIDVHVHGGGGADTMDGPAGVRELARFHLRHGTTALLPTTITNPLPALFSALAGVAEVAAEHARDAARGVPSGSAAAVPVATVLGAHLEGPFINPQRLGAQPPCAIEPDQDTIERLIATGVIRVVTLAPEVAGSEAAAQRFAAAGARVSFGHTNTSFAVARALAEAVRAAGGLVCYTHLYNAMSQLTGREPGAVGAALADPEAFAEVIFDGHHVHPASFLAAVAAKPDRLMLITDAMRAAGLPDGVSELGGQSVTVAGGAARLSDGTLAGSILTLDSALRGAVAAGVPLPAASAMVSSVPATYLGLSDRGSLAVGQRADLVVMNDDLSVEQVFVAGERVV